MRTEAERVTVRHPVASTSLSMYPPQVPVISPTMFGSLPNISGQMFFIAGAVSNQTSATGAFDYAGRTGTKAGAVWFDSGASNEDKIEFNSSSDNSIYSEGGTVQQAALQALVCIKT